MRQRQREWIAWNMLKWKLRKVRSLSVINLNTSVLKHLCQEVKPLKVICNTVICCVCLCNFSKKLDTRQKCRDLENLPKAKHSWPFTFVRSHPTEEFHTETTSLLSQPISRHMLHSLNLYFQTYQHWRQNRSLWPHKKTARVLRSCQALQKTQPVIQI